MVGLSPLRVKVNRRGSGAMRVIAPDSLLFYFFFYFSFNFYFRGYGVGASYEQRTYRV